MPKIQITLSGGSKTYCMYSEPKGGLKDNQRLLEAGDVISGTFIGVTDPSIDKYDKSHIQVKQADGSILQLNSAGKLNKLIDEVSQGSEVEIVFLGKTEIKTGKFAGKEANNFDVFVTSAAPAKAIAAGDEEVPF